VKDGEIIEINGLGTFSYDEFYNRLDKQLANNEEDKNPKVKVICPKCLSYMFSISYGNYACIANCVCGHSFTIYDG
jgi:hypothetical protein